MPALQNHSVWNAALHASAPDAVRGWCLVLDADAASFLVASAANRTAVGRRAGGIALSSASQFARAVEVQSVGVVLPVVSQLGPGTSSWLRVGVGGQLERCALGDGGDIVGHCDADGTAYVHFGIRFDDLGSGGPGGVSQAYVDAQDAALDAATLASAETYADGVGVAAAAAAVASANAHSDANDATTLAAAETYADAGDTAEATARAAADTAEATTRATNDAATLASAEAYTDAAIAALHGGPDGVLAVNMANADQARSTKAGIIVVTSAPAMTAPRTLTLDAGTYGVVVVNDTADTITVTTGAGTTFDVGAGFSHLLLVTAAGVRNAITGI